MEEAIVLYPTPAIGHLISMVELGKFILTHQPSLIIHILIIEAPYNAGSTGSYISTVSVSFPSIKFHQLPTITLPSKDTANHETLTFDVLRLSNPNVRRALLSISESYSVKAFIMDYFCAAALSVASELNIPGYQFFTSGVGALTLFLYLPTLHQNTTRSFKDLNILLEIPGAPPVPSSDVPKPLLDRHDKASQYFLECSSRFPDSAGIIANTYESLEPRAVKAITDGLCVPGSRTPPLYCIGPLIADDRRGGGERDASRDGVPECLIWLDSQPSQSVVFLCFGSLGLFSKEQLGEIATGLERSGQRFLWVVRNPPSGSHSLAVTAQLDPDLDSLLPDGFLERTKYRGLVVKLWAPQVAVLNHNSVGGFVTHCGWNSVLEAVWAGVPMVAWPLYAEQRLNRVLLVEEMKIALPMTKSVTGFVSANEVEKRVRELMDSEEGDSIRERTLAMKREAKSATSEGGSSRVALAKLVESWKHKMKDTIVLYPCPGRGHIVSMVELGKLIAERNPSISITIIVSTLPFESISSNDPYLASISAANSSISFVHLPPVSNLPPLTTFSTQEIATLFFELPQRNISDLRQSLFTLSESSNILVLVIDFFCSAAVDVSSNLRIPTYYFCASSASALCDLLYFPTTDKVTTKSLKEVDIVLDIPGIPPIPSKEMPGSLVDKSHRVYGYFMDTAARMAKSAGIIVNTFEALEPRPLKAILEGKCTPGESVPPVVYCIGPVVMTPTSTETDSKGNHDCLTWLDSQPKGSVVFLCFGSMGVFPADQVKEIAIGLERSRVRFLWVVRSPRPDDKTTREGATPVEPSLDSLLPEGFLERIRDRGFVVKSWAPQVAVLNHESIGGFVTHCGWNSILEAVCAGVPMLAWPLYAEQKLNRIFMVEEMKVALKVTQSEDGFVNADELEQRVIELMDSDKGKAVRDRVIAMKEAASRALNDGGTSRVAMAKLIDSFHHQA